MTVKDAVEIVREKYPHAIVGIVRGTGWFAAKHHPFGSAVGPYAATAGKAWKVAAERIQGESTK